MGGTLDEVLLECTLTEMVMAEGLAQVAEPTPSTAAPSTGDALSRWDTNRNGRITCREARMHGIAPVRREHPAYRFMREKLASEPAQPEQPRLRGRRAKK